MVSNSGSAGQGKTSIERDDFVKASCSNPECPTHKMIPPEYIYVLDSEYQAFLRGDKKEMLCPLCKVK